MRTVFFISSFTFLLLSIFWVSLSEGVETRLTKAAINNSNDLSALNTIFNTAYIEDYGAIANDGIDDGEAIQLAVDANVTGTVNFIKSRTGGKFIIAKGSVNLDGVNNLNFELHPNAKVVATGNFPAFTSIFNKTSGDVSITNIVFDGFTIGSEYDANANGGTKGSKGGNYNGAYVPNGADPNILNPAVIWIGGVQLNGFTFKNMEITNPSNNGYGIKLHNESGTAFTKNVKIHDNFAHDIGGMFVEIVNQNSPNENRFENIDVYGNKIDNLGIFDHGIAISLAGTGKNLNIHHNTYSNLFFGLELVGGNNVHWHDETFLEGVDHFWSFSKDAAVATGFSRNVTVNNISGQYPTAGPSIVEYVENSTFTDVKILGNSLGGIEVRHSKNVTFFNPKIIAKNFGMFLFTGDNANNSQANENIKIINPDLHGTSVGGNPALAGIGDQLGDITIIDGTIKNDIGPLWILGSGSVLEPKYENVSTELNGVKDILNPNSNGDAVNDVTPSSVEFTEVPIDLIAGDSVEVTVNYTISDPSAYVLVRLENPNGDSPQGYVTKSGSGSHSFTIPVPEYPGNSYRWQAQVLSTDGNWTDLANQVVEGVTVAVSELEEDDSITLKATPNQLVQGEGYDIAFNYSFTGSRWVQAWVTSKAFDVNGNWVKIAQASKQFDSGTGNDGLSIQITGQPSNRNLLFVQVFEVIRDNGKNRWSLVLEKRVDDIGLEDNNSLGAKDSSAKELSVSPNPFSSSFTYEYSIQKHGFVNIELFSIYGLKVMTLKQSNNHEAGSFSDTIDTTDLDSGIYILRIKSPSGNEEKRLIKN
ncbi:T9SS type A sorting domain-containing protein [Maribacter sp. 2308TA10-17]|uniref:T9SS type A sorting domain-containing protein n=1 Tax=Maribacter sp. 2308TA10-17 TaxID=3386276 RepID=UPI0039BC463D